MNNPKIILFGSRTDDNKKGGDIDILVQTDENVDLRKQIKILAECEIKGISRKIDMLFQTPFTQDQAIFKTAMKEGILL
ncbi:nucleotidyltransferase domain-containing protein [Sulfurimonas sp.]|uniref:nucleotidyltransferase domain-containing protein n=1 Tax=Sulfurimonas sp. TaxID=2022749 RepID=UPI0025D2F081|nr:nucleotidyltransferase domain-containing protein [Sulfurimonas sp.]